MNSFKKYSVLLILFLFLSIDSYSSGALHQWQKFSESDDSQRLISWIRCMAKEKLSNQKCFCKTLPKTPQIYGRFGLFITIVKNKKVRGCFGSFHHRSIKVQTVINEYLHDALINDIRHEPISIDELDELRFIVTIAGPLKAVANIDYVDIANRGLVMTRFDTSKIVFVPAEVRTIDYMKRVINEQKVIEVNSFRAVTITEKRSVSE